MSPTESSQDNPSGDALPPQAQPPTPSLALIRTDLANERTVLAYIRTALMMVVSGVTLLKVYGDDGVSLVLAWLLIANGIVIAMVGAVRYACLRSSLRR